MQNSRRDEIRGRETTCGCRAHGIIIVRSLPPPHFSSEPLNKTIRDAIIGHLSAPSPQIRQVGVGKFTIAPCSKFHYLSYYSICLAGPRRLSRFKSMGSGYYDGNRELVDCRFAHLAPKDEWQCFCTSMCQVHSNPALFPGDDSRPAIIQGRCLVAEVAARSPFTSAFCPSSVVCRMRFPERVLKLVEIWLFGWSGSRVPGPGVDQFVSLTSSRQTQEMPVWKSHEAESGAFRPLIINFLMFPSKRLLIDGKTNDLTLKLSDGLMSWPVRHELRSFRSYSGI